VPELIHRYVWKKVGQNRDEMLAREIRLFYSGSRSEIEEKVDDYRKKQIGILLLFFMIGILLLFLTGNRGERAGDIRIWRNGFGEGQKEESLLLESGETIRFTVEEREYEEKERMQAFQDGFQWIQDHVLNENRTVHEVRTDLNFMTEVPGGIRAEWISQKPDILGHDGQVFNQDWIEEKQETVSVQLILSYQDYLENHELEFCIVKPDYTAQEELVLKIKGLVLDKEQKSRGQESFVIPGVIDGVSVKQPETDPFHGVWMLLGAMFLFLFFYQNNRLKEEGKERYRQLEEDYPILVHKLVLYLGSGINLRRSFQQITEEYVEDLRAGRTEKRYMYEEMIVMINEMNAGEGEQAAYEALGFRMENPAYTKLISLLVQNLQKGNDGLLNALRTEENSAFFLRMDHAKRLAEEAGTKLLFPMLLMLVIVMAIVMIPALLQFGGI